MHVQIVAPLLMTVHISESVAKICVFQKGAGDQVDESFVVFCLLPTDCIDTAEHLCQTPI